MNTRSYSSASHTGRSSLPLTACLHILKTVFIVTTYFMSRHATPQILLRSITTPRCLPVSLFLFCFCHTTTAFSFSLFTVMAWLHRGRRRRRRMRGIFLPRKVIEGNVSLSFLPSSQYIFYHRGSRRWRKRGSSQAGARYSLPRSHMFQNEEGRYRSMSLFLRSISLPHAQVPFLHQALGGRRTEAR